MENLLKALKTRHTSLSFKAGSSFYWAAGSATVFFARATKGVEAEWALLHETGHALLGHQTYTLDTELLAMELAAWQRAKQLAHDLGTSIDSEHIEDCLDTYRNWIYRRSICPLCEAVALQTDAGTLYECFNCGNYWRVAKSRFCRPYRFDQNPSRAHFNR